MPLSSISSHCEQLWAWFWGDHDVLASSNPSHLGPWHFWKTTRTFSRWVLQWCPAACPAQVRAQSPVLRGNGICSKPAAREQGAREENGRKAEGNKWTSAGKKYTKKTQSKISLSHLMHFNSLVCWHLWTPGELVKHQKSGTLALRPVCTCRRGDQTGSMENGAEVYVLCVSTSYICSTSTSETYTFTSQALHHDRIGLKTLGFWSLKKTINNNNKKHDHQHLC